MQGGWGEWPGLLDVDLSFPIRKLWLPRPCVLCKGQGVTNPLVKYGDTISVRAGYVLCQPHTPDYSWLAMRDFSTEEVLQRGVATANTCGAATASPKPREVTLFVRPLSWWERMKQ